MCGLFIDGHYWEWASPREVKTTLDYLGVFELRQFIQQHLIAQSWASHAEKPLETKEIWVKANFVLDWERHF